MSWRPHEGHEIRSLAAVRPVPIAETTLSRAALKEIQRLGEENKRLRFENARLVLIAGRDTAGSERTLDLRSELTRGDLDGAA